MYNPGVQAGRQWHQLELPFSSPGEPTYPPPTTGLLTRLPLVGNPVEYRCETCGWPVDTQSVSSCDVENCRFMPNSSTERSTGEPQ